MTRHTTIHIRNQYLKFSAAHFTIFSATSRERLHGHNYAVTADFTAKVGDEGLCFDYNIMKKKLRQLCDGLDEYLLLPANSPHLKIEQIDGADNVLAEFDGQKMQFLASDTIVMPLTNVTAEELSCWLLQALLEDDAAEQYAISAATVYVASGEGQAASTTWHAGKGIL